MFGLHGSTPFGKSRTREKNTSKASRDADIVFTCGPSGVVTTAATDTSSIINSRNLNPIALPDMRPLDVLEENYSVMSSPLQR